MKAQKFSARSVFFITFIACVLAMAFALYLELVKGIHPCPLCVLQRIAVVTLGVICLIATLHNPKRLGVRIYSLLSILACAGGLVFSIRQLWLQSLPPGQAPSCGAGIGYLFASERFLIHNV